MQRLYSCRLELADVHHGEAERAGRFTKLWVGRQYGGWPAHDPKSWNPEPGAAVKWHEAGGDTDGEAEAFELSWDRPNLEDGGLLWRTLVQVTVEDGIGRMLVREELISLGVLLRPVRSVAVRRPDVVVAVVRAVGCVDGGRRLQAEPEAVDAAGVLSLDAFIRGGRQLPVVLVAADERGRFALDAARIADELCGQAHVLLLPGRDAVASLTAELGAGRGVEVGGVRLLWPAWRSGDPAGTHPTWPAADVAGPSSRVPDLLIRSVRDAAVARLDDAPFVDELFREQARAERDERRVELERLRSEAGDTMGARDPYVVELEDELSQADRLNFELELELDREKANARRAWEYYALLAEGGQVVPRARETLTDVMRRADRDLAHVVVLPVALRGARRTQYDDTGGLWLDLVALEQVLSDWESGGLRGSSFKEACRRRGLDWAGGVGRDAAHKHAEYSAVYNGTTVLLDEHLRRSGPQLLRMYCHRDRGTHSLVIGHVGAHLPDRST